MELIVLFHYYVGFEDFICTCDDDPTLEQITAHGAGDLGIDRAQYTTNHCKLLDHSTTPLYTMNLIQLREIVVSLKRQLSGKLCVAHSV